MKRNGSYLRQYLPWLGLLLGVDALAALPFGILVLQSVIDKGYTESGKKFRIMSGSSILACVLLLAVYMGLAYLGATVSAQYTSEIGRAQLVMAIVEALMGKTGMIIFGIVVGLACITTAVALTSSAAAYFARLCRGKVSYKVFVIAICVFSAVVSNLGLDRIVAIAAPVLDVVYPPTLVLIFISLVVPRLPDRISRGAVIGALLILIVSPLKALLFVVMVLAIQQVDGAFIYPRIVGRSVGLPGVAVFCAVIVGGNVAGVIGAMIGVPVCALIYALLREAVDARLRRREEKLV